jgi:hypothetical protein
MRSPMPHFPDSKGAIAYFFWEPIENNPQLNREEIPEVGRSIEG